MPKRVLRWNVFVSKSKKKKFAGQYDDYLIDVNLTHHSKENPVSDSIHTFNHELLHHTIDISVHPKKIGVRKQHFIIRKLMEDFH
jgi:hypothetical protein